MCFNSQTVDFQSKTPIFRVEYIFAIFANFDFARNFPPAKIISTANGISRIFPPRENKILIVEREAGSMEDDRMH